MDELSIDHKKWLDQITAMRDIVLGNLVMVSQIPAETFHERDRAEFILQRLKEQESVDAYIDESDNVVAVLKGHTSERRIAISAGMDTRFDDSVDHNVAMGIHGARGAGIANNSMGVAAVLSLPDVLARLGLELDSDLIFLGTTRAHGRGDLQGMRHFMTTYPFGLDYVLNIMGTTLGRVDHFSQSSVRADISCIVESPDEFSTIGFGHNNAIIVLNELVNSLLCIPIPNRPRTSLNIGRIRGGESYSAPCPAAYLNLQVQSEDDSMTDKIMDAIRDCCVDIGSRNGVKLEIAFFGRQLAVGLRFSHPLVRYATQVVKSLGFKPVVAPSNTQIVVPLSKHIPSITLGVTTGKQSILPDGHIELKNIPKGILQILLIINAIDKGMCDEKPA